jgi:HPt (histidine-containing phosphotransfer) domain-containing protein
MDGLEAAAHILKLDPEIPIVAMTANIMSNDIEIYRMNGISDYVGKPFTSQELWRCLLKYFEPLECHAEDETERAHTEKKLRQKLIGYFVRDNQTRFSEIIEALDTGDIKLAHRLAHTLKSNAGQLDQIALQQAAANVERNLKDEKNLVTQQQMDLLETELKKALTKLAQNLDEPPAAVQAELLDAASARELIEKLGPLLEMGNPECREFTQGLRAIPESEELIRQIEDLDFDQAVATLAELKKKLDMEVKK